MKFKKKHDVVDEYRSISYVTIALSSQKLEQESKLSQSETSLPMLCIPVGSVTEKGIKKEAEDEGNEERGKRKLTRKTLWNYSID
jgi:hypothetical protein